ncbi:MAG: endonuclease MutS2 [Nitrospirae bacterium]|nr:endonuclease MutS2 [Nitrospirota bacterium]
MNIPALTSLEFIKLLGLVSEPANSDLSAKAVMEVRPFTRMDEIRARQALVGETMRMSEEGRPLRLSRFFDISPLISKVRPEGAMLDAYELGRFVPFLTIASSVSGQIGDTAGVPGLKALASDLTGFPDLFRLLRKSVDSEGAILDTASHLLADLRDRTRRLDARIRKNIEELVRDDKISVFLQDDFITKRSGRWVIPVRMDSKGQVAGVVHDVSNSGETAFMEPLAVINSTNELENLVAEQKAEEIRILKALSSKIRESAQGLESEFRTIVRLDMLNCIALFGGRLSMSIPEINDSGNIKIINGRHPLLYLTLQKTGRDSATVPLDISLGGQDNVMIITGSNAGGKTIAIKTVGLLELMALSGMPVPADSSSSFPLIDDLLVDIGDEQSIENSLSTFSAHISNISAILNAAGSRSLVLIDELGTGTDPAEGAALACAVLKELGRQGALVFATTHLSDIKGFVHRTDGMINASMEFDRKTLMPLYRLVPGQPGQSYAIETAMRFGLPARIIESARELLGGARVEFDRLVADLDSKRRKYEEGLKELEKKRAELAAGTEELERQRRAAELRYKEMLAEAYKEASEVIRDTKKQMHEMLEETRKKEKQAGREALRQVRERQVLIDKKITELEAGGEGAIEASDINEGDTVFVRTLGYDAVVTQVNRSQNRVKVRSGGMDIELPVSDIGSMRGKAVIQKKEEVKGPASDDMPEQRINLVGLRVDEAISLLEPFLNHASLSGLPEVTIIHGFGAGILGRAVREHLKGHPLIGTFRPGERTEGGGGVTVAKIK